MRSRVWTGTVCLMAAVAIVTACPRSSLSAQPSVAGAIADGDREIAARRPLAALAHYETALTAAPNDYDVLCRTSRTLVDLAEFDDDKARRTASFTRAVALARRAIAADSTQADGHFHLARALGREALTVSARERVRYALDVREAALRALAIDSMHAGALHVMGRWHAEIMRLNSVTRMVARTFMGGKVLGEASWRESVRLLERAAAVEPGRTVHLLALAQVYRDAGDKARARTSFVAAIEAPLQDANDEGWKREAERELRALRDG